MHEAAQLVIDWPTFSDNFFHLAEGVNEKEKKLE